jgi:hypothetical protein
MKAAAVESLPRHVNERMQELNDTFTTLMPMSESVRESSDQGCADRIEMSVAEYEGIRNNPGASPSSPGTILRRSRASSKCARPTSWWRS